MPLLKTYMPTLPDYLGVSHIQTESPALPYKSPNLLEKTKAQPDFDFLKLASLEMGQTSSGLQYTF